MATAFDAVSTIRTVLGTLEEQYVLITLLKDVLDRGLTVAIGAEHGILPLADCSVVVAPYEVDGERAGTVGVLGPTRMHYDQALAAVAVVSKKLSRALSEGGDGPDIDIARDRAADDRAIEDRAADDRATGYPGGPEPERTSRNG